MIAHFKMILFYVYIYINIYIPTEQEHPEQHEDIPDSTRHVLGTQTNLVMLARA